MLAKWIGAPMDEITYTCAGINHQAFYLKYDWNGKDAYPLLHAALEKPEICERGTRTQRNVQGLRLLCDRVLRPQFRIQLVVPQTPGPDRKILHRTAPTGTLANMPIF